MPHTYTWDKLDKNANRLNPRSRGYNYSTTPKFEKIAILPFLGTKTCLVKLQAWGVTQNNLHQVTLLFGDCDIKEGDHPELSLWDYFKIEYEGKTYYIRKFDRLRNTLTSRCTCFTGDTKILLADGTSKTFKELEGQSNFDIIAYNEQAQEYEKVKAYNCEKKKENTKVIKVILDDGKEIKCTPDHRFLLDNGIWIQAKDLRKGSYLCSIFDSKENINKLKYHIPNNPYYLYTLLDPSSKPLKTTSMEFNYSPVYIGKTKNNEDIELLTETLGYTPAIQKQNILLEDWVADRFRSEIIEEIPSLLNEKINIQEMPCRQKLNYKVQDVQEINNEDVYCLTSEYLGNFIISFDKEDIVSGIVVENCKDFFFTFAWYNYYNAHCLYGPAPRPYRKKTNRPPRNACFTGNTKIKLLNGEIKTFKELVDEKYNDFYVYSFDIDNNKFVPGLAKNPHITKYVDKLIKVELDDGSIETCTLDHKWLLRDGTYVEAQNLKVGDSLRSIYSKDSDYESLYDYRSNKFIATHRLVAQYKYGEHIDYNKYNIHHINKIKKDNEPDNLILLSRAFHAWLHGKSYDFHKNLSNQTLQQISENKVKWWQNETNRNKTLLQMAKAQQRKKDLGTIKPKYKNKKTDINKYLTPQSYVKMREAAKQYHNLESTKLKKHYQALEDIQKGKIKPYGGNNNEHWKDPEKKVITLAHFRASVAKTHETEEFKEKMRLRSTTNYKINYQRKRIIHLLEKIIKQGIDITTENWDVKMEEYKNLNNLSYQSIRYKNTVLKYFSTLHEVFNNIVINHKIKSIQVINLTKPEPVYDLTVEKYHNFALASGPYVHNSGIPGICKHIHNAWAYLKQQGLTIN